MSSPGIQRFLIQRDNACAGATVTASSTKAANNTIYAADPARADASTGAVTLSGSYTGTDDKTIDVEIVGTGGTTPRVSEPVFAGSGNGTMESVTASAAVASQTFTVVLKNLGTDDAKATVDFFGVTLRARDAGTSGNNIRLTVDASGLVYTDSAYTTLALMPKDQARFEGEEYDFGAYQLTAQGEIDPNTPRISFGADPRVYRQYRAVENGKTVYYFDPPMVREVAAGTTVKTVTGTYSVTVTDGVTPANYTSIITLYDLLVELLSDPLVEVVGVVVEDKTPGGMAAEDLPLRTNSYHLGVTGTGSEYVTSDDPDGLSVAAATKTETVTIECTENKIVGGEKWSVTGTGSGSIGTATTNSAFSSTPISFTIPRKLPTSGAVIEGDAFVSGTAFAADDNVNTQYPRVCLHDYRLGANAANKTFTFTYTQRPSNDCACDNIPVEGRPDPDCLGVDIEDIEMALTDTDYLVRQQKLQEFYADKIESNTSLTETTATSARHDIQLTRLMRNVMSDTLQLLFTSTEAITDDDLSAWAATTAYALNDEIINSGGIFRATTAGTSGGSPPTFVTTDYGSTTSDGSVVWTYIRKAPLALWDTYLTSNETLINNLDNINDISGGWGPSRDFSIGNLVVPRSPNGYVYRAIAINETTAAGTGPQTIGTSGASEPTWPTTVGNTVTDNEVIWICDAQFTGQDIMRADDTVNGGADSVIGGRTYSLDVFADRFRAQMAEVQSCAGLTVGKLEASGALAASDCWQDYGDAYYWRVSDQNGQEYMPYFTNKGWHSTILTVDQSTGNRRIISTQECWLAISVGCLGLVQVGDSFTVRLLNVEANNTYQIGDKWAIPIVFRSAQYLQGGVTGNNQHTWSVRGSVVGALSDYTVTHGSEAAYSDSGLGFTIYRGDLPNALGDAWTFAVSREQYRWREDGGPYSSAADIPTAAVLLTSGISATFTSGAGVSFEAGDLFSFTIKQPYSPSHAVSADNEQWHPDSATGTLTIDFGSDLPVDVVAIPWHGLPTGASISWELQDAASSTLDSGTLTWQRGVMAEKLSATIAARKLVITLASATDGFIRWVWAGVPLGVTWDADTCVITSRWAMSRGEGRNPSRKYTGSGFSAVVAWENAGLEYSDRDVIHNLFDSLKSNDDQPLVLIPNIDYAAEAFLHRLERDDLEYVDRATDYAALPTAKRMIGDRQATLRRLNASLEFGPVFS